MRTSPRLSLISGHLLGNLSFPTDTSLDAYRKRGVQFDPQVLYDTYYEVGLEHYKEFSLIFASCTSLSHTNTFNLSTAEKRRLILQQICEVKQKISFTRQNHSLNSIRGFVLGKMLFSFDMSFCVRIGVHSTLYIDSIISLGTEKHFPLLDKAYAMQEFGCFGMTELGHGSNVAMLGTTATFIQSTREFEINTPDSYATKWWIGGAAQTAVKCTVFAQMYVNGKNKGVHAFVVDLRDSNTHQTKNGVIIGDCGSKFENDGIDNGFLIFKKYRVPYDALLDRISQVNSNGEFVSLIEKKEKRLGRMLSALIRGRTSVSACSEANLKHAITIATRWAAVRKQFGPPNSVESPILDYQLTRSRLVPHISNLFASSAACEIIYLKFDEVKELMGKNPECHEGVEYHAILSAFKVLTSEWAFNGIHECRKLCGGIGYSSFSRLGELLAKQDVNLTWEGDNNVLLQQTSAFIVKQMQKVMQGKKIESKTLEIIETDISATHSHKAPQDFLQLPQLQKALKQLFNVILQKALVRLQENAGHANSLFDAWNITQPSLQNLGRVFGLLMLSDQMISKLAKVQQKSQIVHEIMQKITSLFIIDKMIFYSSELLASGYFTARQFEELEESSNKLCSEIGENCVNIVDAIADEDFMHGSSIGYKDGQAYSRLTSAVESQADCYQGMVNIDALKKLTSF